MEVIKVSPVLFKSPGIGMMLLMPKLQRRQSCVAKALADAHAQARVVALRRSTGDERFGLEPRIASARSVNNG